MTNKGFFTKESGVMVRVAGLFIYIIILIFPVTLCLLGCTSARSRQDSIHKEYKRLLDLHRQRVTDVIDDEAHNKVSGLTLEEYERLGDQYARQGNKGMAFLQYYKALSLDPNRTGINYKIGLLFLKGGLTEEALNVFDEILEKEPNNALAYEGKGLAFFANQEFEKSKENLKKTISLKQDLWRPHTYLGLIYDRQKQFDAAINEHLKAISIKPYSGSLFCNLGMSYFLKGEYEKSEEALIKASKIGPVNSKTYNNLGIVQYKLGKYDDALKSFRLGTDEAAAYNNLGYMYMTDGKYQEAILCFKRAIEIKPDLYKKAEDNLKRAKALLSGSLDHPDGLQK